MSFQQRKPTPPYDRGLIIKQLSLDGITLAGDRIVEIKCPFQGRDSALWKAVESGSLPEQYQWQVQHQLLVSKAAMADVFIFDGEQGILSQVAPDPSSWPAIHEAWDRFWEYLVTKTPPPLSKGDVRERDDPEWSTAAAQYLETKLYADRAQKALTETKERLIALTSHISETGNGVTVTRYWRKGSIDYSKVPELAGIELEPYRGAPREETRVSTNER